MTQRSTLFRRLRRNRSGNVMYMTAGLLLPALATIGAGVDLGQAYMAKARLQQACDAGVLAGRRQMADGSFSGQARQAAERMFEFNYPDDIYESRGVDFDVWASGASDVAGRATATVDTIIMHVFGKDDFDLEVNCTARLEIANTDIMMVLDTTGSMLQVNPGDSSSRIASLRTEVMSFYDTMASANAGTAQIRYGFVPYSSNVNVGEILNPAWVNNTAVVPSRTGQFVQTGSTGPTVAWSDSSGFTSWTNTGSTVSGRNSSNCASYVPSPQYVNGSLQSGPTTNSSTSGSNPRTTTTTTDRFYNATKYRAVWSSSACRVQQSPGVRRERTTSSITEQFRYTYQNITYNVGPLLTGGSITAPTGTMGANVTTTWNGCIVERNTVAFDDNAAVPAGALDLDIDMTPNNAASRWNVYLPALAHPRSINAWDSQTSANVTTTNDHVSYTTGNHLSGGWSACPSPAMRLRVFEASDRGIMQSYVDNLIAIGGTYHDVGMIWGTRLMSPTGLFAADNGAAPNGAPISRHIIFMTDGQMAPNPGIYGFQNQEYIFGRVGSNDTTELTARHNARFQHACQQARSRNITVWVIAFGTTLNSELTECASGGNAFQANNSTQLRDRFQQIAQQITRLRLQQ